jgi:hypothetical protein
MTEVPLTAIFGAFLLLFGMGVGITCLFRKTTAFKNPGQIVALSILTGFALLLADRITEFNIANVGTIKAATQQATADAKTINSLKKRGENQSATVDLVATQAAKAQKLSETADTQTKKAEQKLDPLARALDNANATLAKLKDEEGFVGIVIAAQNGDRHSYDQLHQMAGSRSNRFSQMAGQAWLTIFEAHSNSSYPTGFKLPWKEGLDPAKLSFDDLKKAYDAAPAALKPGILEYVWSRNNIPKVDKMDFMMEVMNTDSSLTVVEYAGRYFT